MTRPSATLTLADCRVVVGIAAHARSCMVVERAGEFEVLSGGICQARRSDVSAAREAASEFMELGYVREVA